VAIARMIDLKYGITTDGKLVKVFEDGEVEEVPEGEPTILFRGRDKLAVGMLHYYLELCREDGATEYQLMNMTELIRRFQDFKDTNVTKQPGITMGYRWDGTQS
jgi:hypothetical protein